MPPIMSCQAFEGFSPDMSSILARPSRKDTLMSVLTTHELKDLRKFRTYDQSDYGS